MYHKHLFVSGPPRSGTTLLELMLSSHSRIMITPEGNSLKVLYTDHTYYSACLREGRYQEINELLETDDKLNNWPGFEIDSFFQRAMEVSPPDVGSFLDQLFLYYAEINCKKDLYYLGNKKGLYASDIAYQEKQIYPDAKFIFIVRDPRDAVKSMMQNLDMGFLKATDTYQRRLTSIDAIWQHFKKDCFIVRYEDLVGDSEPIVRSICDFISLPYERDMLHYYELNLDSRLILRNKKDIHKNTTKPLNPTLIGQWHKTNFFGTSQLRFIELITGSFLIQYDYEVTGSTRRSEENLARAGLGTYRFLGEIQRKFGRVMSQGQ